MLRLRRIEVLEPIHGNQLDARGDPAAAMKGLCANQHLVEKAVRYAPPKAPQLRRREVTSANKRPRALTGLQSPLPVLRERRRPSDRRLF